MLSSLFSLLASQCPFLVAGSHASSSSDQRQACDAFARSLHGQKQWPNTTIRHVEYYPVSSYAAGFPVKHNDVAFCEVSAAISYGPKGDNSLNFKLWLPDPEFYSHRFLAVGNGGFAGEIRTWDMLDNLDRHLGFAVAGGDSGHLAAENNNGKGEPGKYLPFLHDVSQVKMWIHDSIATFTPIAQDLVRLYYSAPAKYSYFSGCSTGGAQGFALSQRHPNLFDGIIASCPGFWYSNLALSFLWGASAARLIGSDGVKAFPLQWLAKSVLDYCDRFDGVLDGVIENPLSCDFEVSSLACNANHGQPQTCLRYAQLELVNAIYAGPARFDDKSQIYPGFSFGSEAEWHEQLGPLAEAFSIPLLQNLVYDNMSYDARTFNWRSHVDDVEEKAGPLINATNTDLSVFRDGGGKMMVFQGWADPYNAATLPIQYLQHLEHRLEGDVSDFFRLFMVPGGGHCGPAPNGYQGVPTEYRALPALVKWVEKKRKPEYIMAYSTAEMGSRRNWTKKLCPWPKTARLFGEDQDSWESYLCRDNRPSEVGGHLSNHRDL